MDTTIISQLKELGERVTAKRAHIVRELTNKSEPTPVSDIVAALADKGVSVNKTTVYRDIAWLTREGFVQEVDFGDRKKRYELATGNDHHHHIVCQKCEKITDVYLDKDIQHVIRKISNETGYSIEEHTVEFFGICANCK